MPGDARHQPDRQKHRDDRHRRGEHREADLVGGVDRGLIGRFAHPHVAHDIFDLDDRIVDQHAGNEAKREQGHHVEREAHEVHEQEGRYRRQRDGKRRDQRRAPVAQEKEDDDDRKDRALDHRIDRRMILALGIFDVAEQLGEFDLGVFLLEFSQLLDRRVVNGDIRGALGALEPKGQHLPPVLLRDRALLGVEILDLGDIGEAHGPVRSDRDQRLAEGVGAAGVAEDADGLLGACDLHPAAGRIDVELDELGVHRGGGETIGAHALGV